MNNAPPIFGLHGIRCGNMRLAEGEFSGGFQVPCRGRKNLLNEVVNGCGEPCSFVKGTIYPYMIEIPTRHVVRIVDHNKRIGYIGPFDYPTTIFFMTKYSKPIVRVRARKV